MQEQEAPASEQSPLLYADVGGARLRYVDKGSGPPLLLIHGLGASHQDWNQQIDFFARVFRVIAPDLRGHGDSEGEGPYTVERFATDLAQLLDQLRVGPFFTIAHSMGGAVAMQLALFKPERAQKLVLADTLPDFRPDSLSKRWLYAWRMLMMRVVGPKALAKRTAEAMFPEPDQAALRQQVAERNMRTRKAVYLALLPNLARWSVTDKLSWLSMPVLVIAGEHDYFPPAEAQAFAEQLPNGRCRILAGAHHHLPLERADDFNRLAMEFLMPGSQLSMQRGDNALNWLRIDPAVAPKIDVQALLRKPK